MEVRTDERVRREEGGRTEKGNEGGKIGGGVGGGE